MNLTGKETLNAIAFQVEKSKEVLISANMSLSVDEYLNNISDIAKREIMNSNWILEKEQRWCGHTFKFYNSSIMGGKNTIIII